MQDVSLKSSVVDTFKDVLVSPEENMPMMRDIGEQIAALLSSAESKTQALVATFTESLDACVGRHRRR